MIGRLRAVSESISPWMVRTTGRRPEADELSGFEDFGWNDTFIIGLKAGANHG